MVKSILAMKQNHINHRNMRTKTLIIILVAVAMLLLIPFIAMQFTSNTGFLFVRLSCCCAF